MQQQPHCGFTPAAFCYLMSSESIQ